MATCDTACLRGWVRCGVLVFALIVLDTVSLPAGGTRQADGGAGAPEGTVVFVSIPPQQEFVERIAGSRLEVRVLAGPGADPHTYEPTPRQVAELSSAAAYFRIGADFESGLLPRLQSAAPSVRIVDLREGIRLRPMDPEVGGSHEGHGGEGLDPHIWMSPKNVIRMARTIADTLEAIYPEEAAGFEEGYRGYVRDLEELDARISSVLAPHRGAAILVRHPSFGYFADAYGLRQLAVERLGSEPGTRELAELVEMARSEGVRVVFAQPQYAQESARAVAREIGGVVVFLDPLAPDYLQNMQSIADAVREALR